MQFSDDCPMYTDSQSLQGISYTVQHILFFDVFAFNLLKFLDSRLWSLWQTVMLCLDKRLLNCVDKPLIYGIDKFFFGFFFSI